MSQATDWFLADVDEAADLAASLPDELAEGWKHVSLTDVLELEIEELAKILLGSKYVYRPDLLHPEGTAVADDGPSVTSEVLESGVFVTAVPESFVRALAALPDADFAPVASAWQGRAEHLREWSHLELVAMLETMRDFARSALASKKRVLNVFEV